MTRIIWSLYKKDRKEVNIKGKSDYINQIS